MSLLETVTTLMQLGYRDAESELIIRVDDPEIHYISPSSSTIPDGFISVGKLIDIANVPFTVEEALEMTLEDSGSPVGDADWVRVPEGDRDDAMELYSYLVRCEAFLKVEELKARARQTAHAFPKWLSGMHERNGFTGYQVGGLTAYAILELDGSTVRYKLVLDETYWYSKTFRTEKAAVRFYIRSARRMRQAAKRNTIPLWHQL